MPPWPPLPPSPCPGGCLRPCLLVRLGFGVTGMPGGDVCSSGCGEAFVMLVHSNGGGAGKSKFVSAVRVFCLFP